MVCYCNKRKLIYIHVPKTGGLTIENILIKKYGFKYFKFESGRYDFLNDPRGKLGIFRYILLYSREAKKYDLKSFKVIAFVRNPYERAISAVKYLRGISQTFPDTIDNFNTRCELDTYYYMHFCLSQTDCLKDDEGNLRIDYLGRFENLIEDLKRILIDELNFPNSNFDRIHKNKSSSILPYDRQEICLEVDKIHRDDFVNFKY